MLFIVLAASWTSRVSAGVSTWVDFSLANGQVLVDTAVSGIPGKSLIDSGAQINVINQDFLRLHDLSFATGKNITLSGVKGSNETVTYRDVPVSLFGNELNFKDVVAADLGQSDLQLLIGSGFLHLMVFQLDYQNERMRVFTRDALDLKALKNVKSRRDPNSGAPIIQVRINDERNVWLLLDTGSSGGVLLDRRVAQANGWLDQFVTVDSSVRGVVETAETETFRIPTLGLGPFELGDVPVTVPASGEKFELFTREGNTASRINRGRYKFEGILGYDVLRHFVVTIDYKSGAVHLGVNE